MTIKRIFISLTTHSNKLNLLHLIFQKRNMDKKGKWKNYEMKIRFDNPR
jgi:hypothetical protein